MSTVLSSVLVVTGLGLAAGLLLVLAAKFMYVPADETAAEVRALLPGANCGACGFAGCDDYAAAVASGKAPTNKCTVGADAVAADIAKLMGVAALDVIEKCAVVACRGCVEKPSRFEYEGLKSCAAAAMLHAGPASCAYGCLGFGDCVSVCGFDAMHLVDGVAAVDYK
ncbi:MAG: RnfABCDGE type electron transport complex subunit B [Oscillospiraceae bacterium]|nr:RnfABCDGE type electron transport complex subunit B [Oscillospiraceae bacterium]